MSLVIESQHFRAVTGSLCPDLKVPYPECLESEFSELFRSFWRFGCYSSSRATQPF